MEKLKRGLGTLSGKVVAVLGLAFKPNTDDVRESRALKICMSLLAEQCGVRVFDPAAMDSARRNLNHNRVTYCSDSYEAVSGCDAVVIATEWNEFRNIDLNRVKQRMRGNVLVDAKNLLDPSKAKSSGFQYCGMGRGQELEASRWNRGDAKSIDELSPVPQGQAMRSGS